MSINKKGQFGPDALVGIVLVAVLGLGGIFFLNTFVNGLALHGLLSILDSEIDQRCFFILLPLIGDEYSRAGANVTDISPFNKMVNYFGGESNYSYMSYEFNNTIHVFKDDSINHYIANINYIYGYIATESKAVELRNKTQAEMKDKYPLTDFCSIPIYSPAGKVGTAELLISET
jgi:hypothetical protein